MTDDVGTTYFSYRGPSPMEAGNGSQMNRSTIRSVHSSVSDRGDNNDITTLSVRPYQSDHPDIPPPSHSVLLLSPPYPDYLHQPPHPHPHPHLAPPYTPFDSIARDSRMDDLSSAASPKVHPDFTKCTENLRQCVLLMGIVFLLVFGVAIFMAVYYGNNYSSS